jgi:transposase
LRLATVSTGDTIENPRHSRCAEQKLKTLHKQARGLVDTYDTLVFEDLSSSNMRRRPKPKQDDDGTSLGPLRTPACVPTLWGGARSGPECRTHHCQARTEPSADALL